VNVIAPVPLAPAVNVSRRAVERDRPVVGVEVDLDVVGARVGVAHARGREGVRLVLVDAQRPGRALTGASLTADTVSATSSLSVAGPSSLSSVSVSAPL
jgi:hypothetical protein